MSPMNIIAIIPARGGSKRVPRKNIIPLGGKPLIAYSIEHAKRSKLVSRIFVSTDDDEISCISEKYGAEVIRRPAEISGDISSSESALIHTLNYLKTKNRLEPDLIVFLQCTSPLRDKNDIDNAINTFIQEGADSLFSAFRFNKYIWQRKDGSVSPINYDYHHRWREQEFPYQVQENGSIYIMKPWILEKCKNRLGGKIAIYEMDALSSLQVDEYEDISLCECILNKMEKYRI